MRYYMKLMKRLEEADKVHVLEKQLMPVVVELKITSYLQIGIVYNYFCEEPLRVQPNHTVCSKGHNIIIISCVMQQISISEHVLMYVLNLPPYFQKLLQFDTCQEQNYCIYFNDQGCMFDSKISYYNANFFLLRMWLQSTCEKK